MPYRGFINFSFLARHIGKLLWVEAILMAIPFILSLFYGYSHSLAFIYSIAICALTGGVLLLCVRPSKSHIGRQESFLVVGLSWIAFSFFGSLPFYFSHSANNFTDAIFETVSGFTTTGATIMPDIESLSKPILFWRSFIQWIGGIGIIVLIISLVPTTKRVGSVMYAVEYTGPGTEREQLRPRIAETVRRITLVYILLTVLQTITLCLFGFSLFNALCYAFSTISTGGFALHNHNLAEFTPAIQSVFTVFMFLSAINYVLLFYILTGHFFKAWKKDEQFRWYVRIMLIAGIILSLLMVFRLNFGYGKAIHYGFFYAASFLSTTSYTIVEDTSIMPLTVLTIFYVLILIGGCAGSGSGGFKIIRVLLFSKNALFEFNRQMHPRAILPIRYNGKIVKEEVIRNVLAFFFLFSLVLASGVFLLSICNIPIDKSISLAIAAFCNAGPSIVTTCYSCSYITLPILAKWTLMALMMLGRLEIFTILILFSRYFWQK